MVMHVYRENKYNNNLVIINDMEIRIITVCARDCPCKVTRVSLFCLFSPIFSNNRYYAKYFTWFTKQRTMHIYTSTAYVTCLGKTHHLRTLWQRTVFIVNGQLHLLNLVQLITSTPLPNVDRSAFAEACY